MMQITVEVREVYGRPVLYPICPKAQAFADLLGRKQLTERDVRGIRKIGFSVGTIAPRKLDAYAMSIGGGPL